MAYNLRRLLAQADAILLAKPYLSLGELARELRVDRHTVEKAVRVRKRTSYREYQKEKRLRKALILLAHESTMSIKEIAGELGYRSSEPFSRFIKSATGRTPTELRNRPLRLVRRKKK